ncbi:MAG: non-canonical purine NTP pyrophosphatase [Gemmatimonas sp.]
MATRSAGKLGELRVWFAAIGVAVESLDDAGIAVSSEEDALESGDTFEANALAKARWFHARSGGRVVVADDSGLEVDALDGAPGVRSKRWSGRTELAGAALDAANNAHVQRLMARAADEGRTTRRARFVCAAACVWERGECVVRGTTQGVMVSVARGDGGFGYDPYFLSDDLGVTFAEASRESKSTVSHRGRAFALLIEQLGRIGVGGGRVW